MTVAVTASDSKKFEKFIRELQIPHISYVKYRRNWKKHIAG
jgi:hypothetical protein